MSLRLYFQHILRTLLCIGVMATLFCQQNHAVNVGGQDYFFIQFINIDESNDCRFVRALWNNNYGVEVGEMQTDNEQQGINSDPVGFWRWDGDLLVCYHNNRYLCFDEENQKYSVTYNRNEAVPMERVRDVHGNYKLRRKGQTASEMGFGNPIGPNGEADVVDVPSTGNAKYAIGTSTTYEEALLYQNETVSNAFYIRFTNRNSPGINDYRVVTDNGVGNTLTMTLRGNNPNTESDDAKNRLWTWVRGKYLQNLKGNYIYLDGTTFKTTAERAQASIFRIYTNVNARPKLRVLNADGSDSEYIMRAETVNTTNSPVIASTVLTTTDDELELVDYEPTTGQKYFIRFMVSTYGRAIHEMGMADTDTYNSITPPPLCVSSGTARPGSICLWTPNLRSMTWTMELSGTGYHIKSGNGLYMGVPISNNRYSVVSSEADAGNFVIRTRDADHLMTLTDANNTNKAFRCTGDPSYLISATLANLDNNSLLDFVRNDDPMPQDVPTMIDGKWYKLKFAGVVQTLVRAHVDANGYYLLEHDKGRYVCRMTTGLGYTTDISQAAQFEIRVERSGWHLECRNGDTPNVKVTMATGDEFYEVYHSRNRTNSGNNVRTDFSFEEADVPEDVEATRPTMDCDGWYEQYFHDVPICARKAICDGVDEAGNRIFKLKYGSQYLKDTPATDGKYTTTTEADEAARFTITLGLGGWQLTRLTDVNNFYGGYTIATKPTGNNRNVTYTEIKYPNKPTSWFGIDEIPDDLQEGTKYVFYFDNMLLYGMYDSEMESGKDCDLIGNPANYGGMAWMALVPDGNDGNTDFYYRFQNEFGRFIAWNATTNRYQVTNDANKAARFTLVEGDYGYMLKHFGTDNVLLPPTNNNTYTFTEKAIADLNDTQKHLTAIYFREVTSNDAWFDDSTKDLEILHRPSFFQQRANDLGSGAFPREFLQPGTGLTERTLSNGTTISTQNTPEYRLTRYVKKGDFVGLYLTTSKATAATYHKAYQRLYLYDSDEPLTHKYFMPFNDNDAYVYKNGLVFGNALTNSDGVNLSKTTTAGVQNMFIKLSVLGRLPTDENQVTIACDFCYDKVGDNYANDLSYANGSATTAAEGGDLTEPTLSLRQIWTLIDAKVMANELVTKTGDDWLEERTIHFSNKTQGLMKEYVPLSNDLENYWIYKNYTGTDDEHECTDENLVQVGVGKTTPDRYYIIETTDHGSGITVDPTLPRLPQSMDIGDYVKETDYKRRRHISFSYPDSRRVPGGSSIDIKVYAYDADGNKNRYNIAKFTLIFDPGTETLPYMDIVGNDAIEDYIERSPEALLERCGTPHAYLNFDYHHEFGFTSPTRSGMDNIMAALPLDYATTNYAYARRITNNNWDPRIAAGWGSSGVGRIHTTNVNGSAQYMLKSVSDYIGISYPDEYDRGYLFVDASDMPGQVATVSFEGDFCEGSLLMCSGWMASVDGGWGNHSAGSVILTVMGRKYDENDNITSEDVVYSFCPGQLPYFARQNNGTIIYPQDNKVFSTNGDWIWQQFYFEFYGDGSRDYYLKIDNNSTSTEGGDYMLDDIWIFSILPSLETGSMLPLCGGELEIIRLENKYETLLNAVGIKEYEDNDLAERTGYLNLTYIDWDKFVREFKAKVEAIDGTTYSKEEFLEKLEQNVFLDSRYQSDYETVFYASLMKDDLDPTKVAYSCVQWSNKFDSELHTQYSFDTFYNNSQDIENNINKVYYTTENDVRKLIFDGKMNISTFEYYHNYLLLAALSTTPLTDINQFHTYFDVRSSCSTHTDLYMKPFIEVDGHKGVQDLDEMSHCLNSIETLAVNLTVYRYDEEDENAVNGYVIEKPSDIYFDWWVGTRTVSGTVNNFLAQDNGKSPTDPDYFTLQHALKCLRYNYPNASILEGLTVPATNDEYSAYTLTADILQYLKDLVTPPDGSMPQLYLHSQTVNVMLDEENFKIEEEEDGDYVYICAMPIELDINSGQGSYYYSCSEPQPIKVRVEGVAPHIDLGFADKKYPDQLDLLSVRLAKSQFEKVNIRNAEDASNPSCLHIPLRNVTSPSVNAIGIKNVGIRNDGVNGDVILLTATTDTEMENYLLSHYNDYVAYNEMNGVKVGTITYLYGTNNNTEEKPSEALAFYFDADFKVREGYSYTLKFPFTERFEDGAEVSTQCDGYGAFIVKIVPDYEVWTESTGNIDWSNDNNWRRASREELYADNGTTLKESYLDNGHVKDNGEIDEPASTYDENNTPIAPYVNYITAEDRQRMQGFAPLYCTNILMLNKEAVDAPELYDDGPEVVNGIETGFPALHTTASPMIRYDFQGHEWPNLKDAEGNSIDTNNEANPNDPSKMVRKEGDIVTELYSTNQCDGIVFQSKTELVNSHLLNYKKAWVEFELPKNKWHLVSSPLQGTISGEWYAPTWSGRQETTYFEPIQFDVMPVTNIAVTTPSNTYTYNLNYDRFAPAVYQRQWDKAKAVLYERGAAWSADDASQAEDDLGHSEEGQWSGDGQGYSWTNNSDEYLNRLVYKPFDVSKVNVAVRGSWSGTHNDHSVPYDNAGFSIMPINNLKEHNVETVNTIFRLPKDDQYYDIWDWGKDYAIERRVRVYINDGRPWPENLRQLVEDAMRFGGNPDDYMPREDDNEEDETNTSNIIELENRGRLRSDFFADDIDPENPKEYSVTLKNEGEGSMGYFLASNPFICGLDMQKFFAINDVVYSYYLVLKDSDIDPKDSSLNPNGTEWKWTDMNFAYYNGSGNAVVPPRYAFFLKKKDSEGATQGTMSEVTLKYTADMMVHSPRMTTTGNSQGGVPHLRIKAERDGNTSEATVIICPDASNKFLPEEDLETFVVSDISSSIPVIYTLTGHLATSINRIHDFMVLPIGIESNSDERVKVTFEGVENLSDSLMLYDTMTEELLPLQSGTTTQMPGRTQNRFYILKGENLQEAIEESCLQIYVSNGKVTITSTTSQPITEVRVYDAGGRQVYEATPNRPKHRFNLLKGTYVVKAKTDSVQQVKKVRN